MYMNTSHNAYHVGMELLALMPPNGEAPLRELKFDLQMRDQGELRELVTQVRVEFDLALMITQGRSKRGLVVKFGSNDDRVKADAVAEAYWNRVYGLVS